MVYLLRAFHFRRVMREVLVHSESEDERAALVHALVGLDRKCEIQDVVGVRECHFHCVSQRELLEVYTGKDQMLVVICDISFAGSGERHLSGNTQRRRDPAEVDADVPRWTRS